MSCRPKPFVPKARRPFVLPARPHHGAGDDVIDHLPPQEQEVVVLASFYGLARDEIAGVIGASVQVVDTLMSQAVEHLRRVLAPSSAQGPQAA